MSPLCQKSEKDSAIGRTLFVHLVRSVGCGASDKSQLIANLVTLAASAPRSDLCREAGIEDSINDQLTGHAPRTIGRAYGDGVDGETMAEAISRLDFEFIDWEPVLRATSIGGLPEAT